MVVDYYKQNSFKISKVVFKEQKMHVSVSLQWFAKKI